MGTSATRGRIRGLRITVPVEPEDDRVVMTFTVDLALYARIKFLGIRPSNVVGPALLKEVRRREALIKLKERKRIVDRFSGQVLG